MRNRSCCVFWVFFFFSSRRRHTRCSRDWSSDVCSSDLERRPGPRVLIPGKAGAIGEGDPYELVGKHACRERGLRPALALHGERILLGPGEDRKSTRLNSSHGYISYAVFCLKKKKKNKQKTKIINNTNKITIAYYL